MVHQRNYGGFLVEIRWVSGGNPPGFWWKSAGFLVEIRRVSGGNPPEFFQIPRKVPEVFRCFSVKCPDGYRQNTGGIPLKLCQTMPDFDRYFGGKFRLILTKLPEEFCRNSARKLVDFRWDSGGI